MRTSSLLALGVNVALMTATVTFADAYDPPAGYYNSATGTGATLKTQLRSIMSSGHIQRTYGNFRSSAAITDRDPNNTGKILLAYNRASVSATWDSGSTWNREHVWPQSLQPGNASNSSQGNLGDPHALRPCNPGINSDRGNKPFGLTTTTGSHRSLGTFYFTGDFDKGDIARNLFYSATRWSSLGLTLVNGTPGGNQMGDLQAAIRWNYIDPPDEFERRRNHAIYSSALNPQYYSNNRNAYIDHPEFVWTVFGSYANDSTLHVGAAPAADGSSTLHVNVGRVLVGAAAVTEQALTLSKDGAAPTYYDVQVTGDATASRLGRFNAFDFDPQDTVLTVGLSGSTSTAGVISGTVTIDNLDPSSGGNGQGDADGDDLVTIELAVLDHAQPSLTPGSVSPFVTASFTAAPDSGIQSFDVPVYNSGYDADQALLDIDAASGATAPFNLVGGLQEGIGAAPATLTFSFDTTGQPVGQHSVMVEIDVSDEDLPGESLSTLDLELVINVVNTAGDADGDGDVDLDDWAILAGCVTGPQASGSTACRSAFDNDADTDIDLLDLAGFQTAFTGP